jgi:hypothetical protein
MSSFNRTHMSPMLALRRTHAASARPDNLSLWGERIFARAARCLASRYSIEHDFPEGSSCCSKSKSRTLRDNIAHLWTRRCLRPEVGTGKPGYASPDVWASSSHRFTNHSRGQRYQDHNPRSLQHCESRAWLLALGKWPRSAHPRG